MHILVVKEFNLVSADCVTRDSHDCMQRIRSEIFRGS